MCVCVCKGWREEGGGKGININIISFLKFSVKIKAITLLLRLREAICQDI